LRGGIKATLRRSQTPEIGDPEHAKSKTLEGDPWSKRGKIEITGAKKSLHPREEKNLREVKPGRNARSGTLWREKEN